MFEFLFVETHNYYIIGPFAVLTFLHTDIQTGRQDLCRLCARYSYIWKPLNTILWEIHVINNSYWSSLVSSDTLSVAYWPLCWKECCPLIWPRQELMMSSWCKAGVKPSILPVSENLTKEKSIWAHAASSMMLSDKSKEKMDTICLEWLSSAGKR